MQSPQSRYNPDVKIPKIAVLSFPGNNCEVESIRAVRRAGMVPVFFRWNDDTEKLKNVDGYFIPGGFSYEDRGRAGMVAARDPLMDFIRSEAKEGKPVIGNCNGAQILVESGLIPLGDQLQMCLARNVVDGEAVGFLNEWIFIIPTCARNRCATSDWEGVMTLPIAHGEGRFITKDPGLIDELRKNDQIAFSYCDAKGNVSEDPVTTPNGSAFAIAGICNPAGNVVALMPHPERTEGGNPYFVSLKRWVQNKMRPIFHEISRKGVSFTVREKAAGAVEIFIDTLIVNNEEHTVEQAAHRLLPSLKLRQLRYLSLKKGDPRTVLCTISLFNPNKEVAYIRRGGTVCKWDADAKREQPVTDFPFKQGIKLLRRDEPDTGAAILGERSETGVCYVCREFSERDLLKKEIREVFPNPHAASLNRLH